MEKDIWQQMDEISGLRDSLRYWPRGPCFEAKRCRLDRESPVKGGQGADNPYHWSWLESTGGQVAQGSEGRSHDQPGGQARAEESRDVGCELVHEDPPR